MYRPRDLETQRPRGPEAQRPRGPEAQRTRGPKTQKPRDPEALRALRTTKLQEPMKAILEFQWFRNFNCWYTEKEPVFFSFLFVYSSQKDCQNNKTENLSNPPHLYFWSMGAIILHCFIMKCTAHVQCTLSHAASHNDQENLNAWFPFLYIWRYI